MRRLPVGAPSRSIAIVRRCGPSPPHHWTLARPLRSDRGLSGGTRPLPLRHLRAAQAPREPGAPGVLRRPRPPGRAGAIPGRGPASCRSAGGTEPGSSTPVRRRRRSPSLPPRRRREIQGSRESYEHETTPRSGSGWRGSCEGCVWPAPDRGAPETSARACPSSPSRGTHRSSAPPVRPDSP